MQSGWIRIMTRAMVGLEWELVWFLRWTRMRNSPWVGGNGCCWWWTNGSFDLFIFFLFAHNNKNPTKGLFDLIVSRKRLNTSETILQQLPPKAIKSHHPLALVYWWRWPWMMNPLLYCKLMKKNQLHHAPIMLPYCHRPI